MEFIYTLLFVRLFLFLFKMYYFKNLFFVDYSYFALFC